MFNNIMLKKIYQLGYSLVLRETEVVPKQIKKIKSHKYSFSSKRNTDKFFNKKTKTARQTINKNVLQNNFKFGSFGVVNGKILNPASLLLQHRQIERTFTPLKYYGSQNFQSLRNYHSSYVNQNKNNSNKNNKDEHAKASQADIIEQLVSARKDVQSILKILNELDKKHCKNLNNKTDILLEVLKLYKNDIGKIITKELESSSDNNSRIIGELKSIERKIIQHYYDISEALHDSMHNAKTIIDAKEQLITDGAREIKAKLASVEKKIIKDLKPKKNQFVIIKDWIRKILLWFTIYCIAHEAYAYHKCTSNDKRIDDAAVDDTVLQQKMLDWFNSVKNKINSPAKKNVNVLVSPVGSGKRNALINFHYEIQSKQHKVVSFEFNAASKKSLEKVVVEAAVKLGMRLLNCNLDYNLDYTSALKFFKEYFANQQTSLITCYIPTVQKDEASIYAEFIKNFMDEIFSVEDKQRGNLLVVSSSDDVSNKLNDILSNDPEFSLQQSSIKEANSEKLYKFFSRKLLPVYTDQQLPVYQSILKNTYYFMLNKPEYPDNEKFLKKEFIKELSNSIYAISMASKYLVAEYLDTKLPSYVLINNYTAQLRYQLNRPDRLEIFNERIIEDSNSTSHALVKNTINSAVTKIAIARVLDKATKSSGSKNIFLLAKEVFPFLYVVHQDHIDIRLIHEYLDFISEEKISFTDTLKVVDILNQYGLVSRYNTSNRKYTLIDEVKASLYEWLGIDSSKQNNIEDREQNENSQQIKLQFHTHPVFIQSYREMLNSAQSGYNSEKILENISNFTRYLFFLKNKYTKASELKWDFISYMDKILCFYRICNKGEKINLKTLRDYLYVINPAMNLCVQFGDIISLDYLYDIVVNLVSDFSDVQHSSKTTLVSLETLLNNDDPNLSEDDEKLIADICLKFAKADPMLPALYAQYIYYYARRILKTDTKELNFNQHIRHVKIAIAMRHYIDNSISSSYTNNKCVNTPKMEWDTSTFKCDGLGAIYIQQNTESSLKAAKDIYNELLNQYNDKFNQSKFKRYLAQINYQLAKKLYTKSKSTETNDCLNKNLSDIKNNIEAAKKNINESKMLSANQSREYANYSKWLRSYVADIQVRFFELKKKINSPINTDSQLTVLDKIIGDALKILKCNTIDGGTSLQTGAGSVSQKSNFFYPLRLDQRSDIVNVNYNLADMFFYKYKLTADQSELDNAVKYINTALRFLKETKILRHDTALLKSYLLKLKILNKKTNCSVSEDEFISKLEKLTNNMGSINNDRVSELVNKIKKIFSQDADSEIARCR